MKIKLELIAESEIDGQIIHMLKVACPELPCLTTSDIHLAKRILQSVLSLFSVNRSIIEAAKVHDSPARDGDNAHE